MNATALEAYNGETDTTTILQGYKYSKDELDITVDGGKKTIQVFCRPIIRTTKGFNPSSDGHGGPSLTRDQTETLDSLDHNDSGISEDGCLWEPGESVPVHSTRYPISSTFDDRTLTYAYRPCTPPEIHGCQGKDRSKPKKNPATTWSSQKHSKSIAQSNMAWKLSKSKKPKAKREHRGDELEVNDIELDSAVRANSNLRAELESAVSARNWYQEQMQESRKKYNELVGELMDCKRDSLGYKSQVETLSLSLKESEDKLREEKERFIKDKEKMIIRLESLETSLTDSPDLGSLQEIEALNQKLILKENMIDNQTRRISQLECEISNYKNLCKNMDAQVRSSSKKEDSKSEIKDVDFPTCENNENLGCEIPCSELVKDAEIAKDISTSGIGESLDSGILVQGDYFAENGDDCKDIVDNKPSGENLFKNNPEGVDKETQVDIPKAMDDIDLEVENKKKSLNDVEKNLLTARKELEETENKLKHLDVDEKKVEIDRIQNEIVNSSSTLSVLSVKLNQCLVEYNTIQADLKVQSKELSRVDKEIDQKYEKLYLMDSESGNKSIQLKNINTDINRANKAKLKLEEEFKSKSKELEEVEKNLLAKESMIEKIQGDLDRMNIEIDAKTKEMENIDKVLRLNSNATTQDMDKEASMPEEENLDPQIVAKEYQEALMVKIENVEQKIKIGDLEKTLTESVNILADLNMENEKMKKRLEGNELAEENRTLKEQLNEISTAKEKFKSDFVELLEQHDQVRNENRALQEELEIVRLKNAELLENVETEKLELDKAIEQLDQVQCDITSEQKHNSEKIEKDAECLEELKAELVESQELSRSKIKELSETKDKLAEELDSVKRDYDEALEAKNRTSIELETCKASIEELQTELTVKSNRICELQNSIENLTSSLTSREEEHTLLVKETMGIKIESDKMSETLLMADTKHSDLIREKEDLCKQFQDLEQIKNSLETGLVALEGQLVAERHEKNLVITGLNTENQELASLVGRLKQEMMVLEDKLEAVQDTVRELERKMVILEAELSQVEVQRRREEEFSQHQAASYEFRIRELENQKDELHRAKSDNVFHIKQLNRALRNSLHHIRSLRTILEGVSPLPGLEEKTIIRLLELPETRGGQHSKLKDLQTCLSSLRKEVKDLNCELSSRCNTPRVLSSLSRSGSLSPFNLSADFTMDSAGGHSATPSLPTSPVLTPSSARLVDNSPISFSFTQTASARHISVSSPSSPTNSGGTSPRLDFSAPNSAPSSIHVSPNHLPKTR